MKLLALSWTLANQYTLRLVAHAGREAVSRTSERDHIDIASMRTVPRFQ